jgi:hypothetical protein
MDPKEFLDLSQELLFSTTITRNEAKRRTIASRSYYAIYLELRDYLEKKDIMIGLDRSHGDLISLVFTIVDRKLGMDVNALKGHRIKADYRITTVFSDTEANTAYKRAERVMTQLPGIVGAIDLPSLECKATNMPFRCIRILRISKQRFSPRFLLSEPNANEMRTCGKRFLTEQLKGLLQSSIPDITDLQREKNSFGTFSRDSECWIYVSASPGTQSSFVHEWFINRNGKCTSGTKANPNDMVNFVANNLY